MTERAPASGGKPRAKSGPKAGAKASAPAPRRPAAPATRARRAVWPLLVSITVVGMLFLFVFPGRTYLAQRRSLAAAEARLHVLKTENKSLDQRVARLQDDAEIERLAREQYGLVKPGEEAYAILPSPSPAPPPTPAKKASANRNWAERLWHSVF